MHSQSFHLSCPCYQIGDVPSIQLWHVSAYSLHPQKKEKKVSNLECGIWNVPDRFVSTELERAGEHLSQRSLRQMQMLSKMLIFDFLQISGTQTEL